MSNHICADCSHHGPSYGEIPALTRPRRRFRPSPFRCMDCNVDTFRSEYYMLKHEIWDYIVSFENSRKMLCIGCVEERLGRELTGSDFLDCPANELSKKGYWPSSDRLQDRLNRTTVET